MTRRTILQGLVAALFGQQVPHVGLSNPPVILGTGGGCPDEHGIGRPCPPPPLKEGEEYCPLQHAQKPQSLILKDAPYGELSIQDFYVLLEKDPYIRRLPYPNVCSICGIVYVPLKKK